MSLSVIIDVLLYLRWTAGLCSRWHPLWGVKWDNRCVWGATYDSPQLFSRTLSQVTPSSYCLRWLPTVVTARFDFGPGSIWFWTRVHLIWTRVPDPGMIMPSLVQLVKVDHPYHANFQCKLDRFHLFVRIHKWLPTVSQVTPHRGWLSATLSRPSSVMF